MKKLPLIFMFLLVSRIVWAGYGSSYGYDEDSYSSGGGAIVILAILIMAAAWFFLSWLIDWWNSRLIVDNDKLVEKIKHYSIVAVLVLMVGVVIHAIATDPNNTIPEPSTVQPVVDLPQLDMTEVGGLPAVEATNLSTEVTPPPNTNQQPQVQTPTQSVEQPAISLATVTKVAKPRRTSKVDEVVVDQSLMRKTAQQQEAETNRHYAAIYAAHPDADAIPTSGSFAAFLDTQRSSTKAESQSIIQSGTTQQVIRLFDQYKEWLNENK